MEIETICRAIVQGVVKSEPVDRVDAWRMVVSQFRNLQLTAAANHVERCWQDAVVELNL